MALIRCPECGGELSTTAPSCPKCGYQQHAPPPTVVRTTEGLTGKFLDPVNNVRGCLRLVVLFLIVGLLLCLVGNYR